MRRHVTVTAVEADPIDSNYSVMTLVASPSDMPRFKKQFGLLATD